MAVRAVHWAEAVPWRGRELWSSGLRTARAVRLAVAVAPRPTGAELATVGLALAAASLARPRQGHCQSERQGRRRLGLVTGGTLFPAQLLLYDSACVVLLRVVRLLAETAERACLR